MLREKEKRRKKREEEKEVWKITSSEGKRKVGEGGKEEERGVVVHNCERRGEEGMGVVVGQPSVNI